MRALIVDDEAPARAKLRHLLEGATGVEVIGEARTGREAIAAIKRSAPDVVFLDIQMPGLDGFDVAKSIDGDGTPYIVFVTANDREALRAFEVGAVDYLLKPYAPKRFEQVLARARARIDASVSTQATNQVDPTPLLRRVLVSDERRSLLLPVEEIDVIESERNYVRLLAGGASYRLRATMSALQQRLDPAQFLRINRSTIVRVDAIREMHEWSHGDARVIMRDGGELTMSRRYRLAARKEFSAV